MVGGSLKNPHAVIVAALTVVLLGGVAVSRIPTDILPTFTTPAVQVLTLYPGMPAEVMEKDITSRLERWTGQSNGISHQEARSMNGVSIVRDYFRPDIDPNTAMSQVSSLAIADMYYLPPGTIPPMIMPFDPTASMPLCLVSVSSPTFDETELYDIAYFELRNRLQGISGVIAPAVYGGRIRRIFAYVDRDKLTARNLSPMDVVKTLKDFNTFIPTGNAKIGEYDYQINANGMVQHVEQMNDFPIRVDDGGATVQIRDVGQVEDTHQIQSNIVRVNGRRQVYIPIYRQPGANTIAVVEGIKETIGSILSRLPKGVNLDVVLDQSVYVRKAIASLEREALFGALLAGVMIWLFIGSLRSTFVIMLSVPLSVLTAIACLYFTGDSLNAMTLGGLALAVGRLVDDSIVVLENTHRHVALGKTPLEAARIAADEVRMPILVATVVTIVVFTPVVFLTGIGKFLFTPLAMSVSFAMVASYVVALTIVPAYCAKFLRERPAGEVTQAGWGSFSDRVLGRLSDFYGRRLGWMLRHRFVTLGAVALVVLLSVPIYPLIGTELFPRLDTGQFGIHMRAPSGTRIERTEKYVAEVEAAITDEIAPEDLQILISNTGVLYDWPAAYTRNAGPMDSALMIQLHEEHGTPSFEYVRRLRRHLREQFPMIEFSFETGGMISSAINFGLPAPINIQVNGNKLDVAQQIARDIRALVESVPGTADVRIQQKLDYPQLSLEIDRAKAALLGINADEAVKNIVTSLNSSVNFDPAFWIDERNGNHYFVGAQYREEDIDSIETLLDIPITGVEQVRTASAMDKLFRPAPAAMRSHEQPVLLRNIAQVHRTSAPTEVTHLNISRVTDVFADVDGRDIGAVAKDIDAKLAGRKWPEGYRVDLRGEAASMRESFGGLAFGFAMAVILVYFVMVALFRSFLDPFIIMLAVPLGLVGVVWMLWATDTTLNIQSFMGTIFMIGIAASTSTLLVEFANRLRAEGHSASDAALEAARIRLRPILMTTGTALLALLPPALNPAEPIMPLARAVIGGLTSSTLLTLVVVPLLYREFKR
jgi:multidrug efflux pump subunit AcrB